MSLYTFGIFIFTALEPHNSVINHYKEINSMCNSDFGNMCNFCVLCELVTFWALITNL